jgi:pilus assembly protein CpaB
MNRRFISVLMFAFVVAGGASFVLYQLVIGRMKTSAPVATSSLVVATKNLESGSVIIAADVRLDAWPGAVPKGAVIKVADAVGRGIAAAIYADEPVVEARLRERGAGGGLASTIPRGMRAVAIRVNEIVGVAGFVVAGSHVDILVSGTSPDSQGGPAGNVTRTLLQNMTVLSAGQDFKKDAEGKPVSVAVVNLLVTPQQAEMLSLVGNQMTMQLVLRNPLDTEVAMTPGVSSSTILSGAVLPPVRTSPQVSHVVALKPPPPHAAISGVAAVPVLAAPAEPPHMEIIEGSRRTDVKLKKTEGR